MRSENTSPEAKYDHLYDTAHSLAAKIAIPPPGDCPYTLFLGAGASVSSDVRPVAALVDAWKQDLFRAQTRTSARAPITQSEYAAWLEEEYPRWLDDRLRGRARDSEYAVLFGRFHKSRRQRQIFIEREIDGKLPGFGYLYLAGLVAARRINRILTTNFDDLVNDALVKFYDIKPVICAFDSAVRSIRFDSLRPKILKMHGDFLYDNVKAVGDEVVRLDANMEEKFLQTCKEGGLVVVGYGGGDESIMGPLQMMIRSSEYLKMGLHWCIYQPDPTAPLVVPARLQHMLDNYGDRITIYPISGFDELMFEVFTQGGCEHPEVFTNPGRKNLFKEFQRTVRSQWESFEIPAGMNEHLELYLEKSGTREVDPELELDQADVKHRKANLCLRERKIEAALELYEASRQGSNRALGRIDGANAALRFRANARLSGALVGIVECRQIRNENWQETFKETLDSAREAERLGKSVSGLSDSDRRAPLYNSLCAYALRANKEALSQAESDAARTIYNKLVELDPGEKDRQYLRSETGYSALAGYIGQGSNAAPSGSSDA